jgi:hypothetical protein
MRESRLLLLKNKTPNLKKKNQNLLSNLVSYVQPTRGSEEKSQHSDI